MKKGRVVNYESSVDKVECINTEMIVGIKVRGKKFNDDFEWKPEEKILFGKFTLIEAGFYRFGHFERVPEEEILKGGYLVGEKRVFNKPYVKVIMVNPESTFKIEFDDIEKAYLFALDMKSNNKNIVNTVHYKL
jgi:hypothetical protein